MKEYERNQSNNELQKIKENNELRSVEMDVVTKFIKDEVEILSDIEVYTDYDNNSENHRVIGFRYNLCDQKQKINSEKCSTLVLVLILNIRLVKKFLVFGDIEIEKLNIKVFVLPKVQ